MPSPNHPTILDELTRLNARVEERQNVVNSMNRSRVKPTSEELMEAQDDLANAIARRDRFEALIFRNSKS